MYKHQILAQIYSHQQFILMQIAEKLQSLFIGVLAAWSLSQNHSIIIVTDKD